MAVLDAVMNNTDRKGGHILPVDGGRHIYGVDHGVTLLARSRSSGRCCGAGAGSRWRRTRSTGSSASGTALDGELGVTLAGCCRASRSGPRSRRTDALLRTRPVPLPLPGLAGDPLAAVLDREQALRIGGDR